MSLTTADRRLQLAFETTEIGRAFAYAAPLLTLVQGGAVSCMYVLAAVGLVAFLRGAEVTRSLALVAAIFAGWFCVLSAIELVNVGWHMELSTRWYSYFILLVFPFFVIGLREIRLDPRIIEGAAVLALLFATGLSLFQFVVLGVDRPGGLGLNPIQFGFVISMLSLFVLARALNAGEFSPTKAAGALAGLIPVLLSGSKMVWIGTAAGYAIIFLARTRRRPLLIAAGAAFAAALATLLLLLDFFRTRILALATELSAFVTAGSLDGSSFGIRVVIARTAWDAFVERPLFGHGLAMTDAAVLAERRPKGFPDFSENLHLHNEYLTHMVAFGIPGLLFTLSLPATLVMVTNLSGDRSVRIFGLAAASALALHMLAESFFFWSAVCGIVFLMLGLTFVSGSAGESRRGRA